jgi:hypothetical protein
MKAPSKPAVTPEIVQRGYSPKPAMANDGYRPLSQSKQSPPTGGTSVKPPTSNGAPNAKK